MEEFDYCIEISKEIINLIKEVNLEKEINKLLMARIPKNKQKIFTGKLNEHQFMKFNLNDNWLFQLKNMVSLKIRM